LDGVLVSGALEKDADDYMKKHNDNVAKNPRVKKNELD
jgi:hypothetical protein